MSWVKQPGLSSRRSTTYDGPPGIFLVNLTPVRAIDRRFVVPVEPGRDIVDLIWRWHQGR